MSQTFKVVDKQVFSEAVRLAEEETVDHLQGKVEFTRRLLELARAGTYRGSPGLLRGRTAKR